MTRTVLVAAILFCLRTTAAFADDVLTTAAVWNTESNVANASYGWRVASAGDVNGDGYSDVLVGAPKFSNGQTSEGKVYLYYGGATGLATTAAWTLESNQIGAELGRGVATAGDVNGDGYADFLVGAPAFTNGQADEGVVYLYRGSAAGPVLAWTQEGNQVSAAFGHSVSTAGDINHDGFADVIIGAPGATNGQTAEGRVFIYPGSATGLGATPWIRESDQANARFGTAVAGGGDLSGDGISDVLIGAPFMDVVSGSTVVDAGTVFECDGSSSISGPTAPFSVYTSAQTNAQAGSAVGIAGDFNGNGVADAAWGVPLGDNGQTDEGFASIADLGGVPFYWNAESDQAGAALGSSICGVGDVDGDGFSDVAIGAPELDDGQTDEGQVRFYRGGVASPALAAAWAIGGGQVGAAFGTSVASAGDVDGDGFPELLIGTPDHDHGETNEGRAYVYAPVPALPKATPVATPDGDVTNARLGDSVAMAGDVNGDGRTDVIAGAPLFTNGEANEGAAYVVLGSATNPVIAPKIEGNVVNAHLGRSVAGAGDVDADGYADVILGAPVGAPGAPGVAQVHRGSASGLSLAPLWSQSGPTAGSNYGAAVAGGGDWNGDGYADVLVGAPGYGNPEAMEGVVFGYAGSGAGPATSPSWSIESNKSNAHYGAAVACAGDVNADGYSDVAVGATFWSVGQTNEGAVFVYLGSASGLTLSPGWPVESNKAGAHFGSAFAAGDFDGDGFSDLAVAAPDESSVSFVHEGAVFVYRGGAAGLATAASWTATGDQTDEYFGVSLSAGDETGDGRSELLVGAPRHGASPNTTGRVFLFVADAGGLAATPAWFEDNGQVGADYGASVALNGDVNGDGWADVVAGAPASDAGQTDEGELFIHLGHLGSSRDNLPRLRRADDSLPIADRGRVPGASFRSKVNAWSPWGRLSARVAVEAKPAGVPFDGTGLVTGAWIDTGNGIGGPAMGATANAVVPALAADTTYRVRARVQFRGDAGVPVAGGPWFSPTGNDRADGDLRVAPCGGSLGIASSYGTGKAGTNGVPVLASLAPPSLGGNSDITLTNGLAGAGPAFFFFGFVQTAAAFDQGTLYVVPTTTFVLPALPPGGTLSIPVSLRSTAAFCGANVYFQAGFVDPGAGGYYHTALTNGLHWVLGS